MNVKDRACVNMIGYDRSVKIAAVRRFASIRGNDTFARNAGEKAFANINASKPHANYVVVHKCVHMIVCDINAKIVCRIVTNKSVFVLQQPRLILTNIQSKTLDKLNHVHGTHRSIARTTYRT